MTADAQRGQQLAGQLDDLNRARREVQAQMQASALDLMRNIHVGDCCGLALYDPNWHHGVIGVLASRLRESLHRPVIALAPASDTEVKGSGRSIPGVNLRDALDLLSKRYPDLLLRFGGHAMAAGITIRRDDVEAFASAFDKTVRSLMDPGDLNQRIEVDGSLAATDCSLEVAELLERQVWGQGFVAPKFCDTFEVVDQRVISGRHRRLQLCQPGADHPIEAIRFGDDSLLPKRIQCVYRLNVNEFNGKRSPQLILEQLRPARG
ncbi:MAG: hypothetical protein GTO41_12645 [Burkholderiales bacterium]|nr:hypothetical protein [Burkholderiales bacterium]